MTDHSDVRLSCCLGTFDEQCLRRAALLGLDIKRAFAACGGENAHVATVANSLAIHELATHDLRCHTAHGLPCPHAPPKPSFRGGELRLDKARVRLFRRSCKQTELLDAFQLHGWPPSIDNPFGSPSPFDAENGLSDIVYELNRHQKSGPQIHFWCDGNRVRWEIVGYGPRTHDR